MGFTFKENCPDLRNSKVLRLIDELLKYNLRVSVYDPWVSIDTLIDVPFKILTSIPQSKCFDLAVVAVAHDEFVRLDPTFCLNIIKDHGQLIDIKGILPRELGAIRL